MAGTPSRSQRSFLVEPGPRQRDGFTAPGSAPQASRTRSILQSEPVLPATPQPQASLAFEQSASHGNGGFRRLQRTLPVGRASTPMATSTTSLYGAKTRRTHANTSPVQRRRREVFGPLSSGPDVIPGGPSSSGDMHAKGSQVPTGQGVSGWLLQSRPSFLGKPEKRMHVLQLALVAAIAVALWRGARLFEDLYFATEDCSAVPSSLFHRIVLGAAVLFIALIGVRGFFGGEHAGGFRAKPAAATAAFVVLALVAGPQLSAISGDMLTTGYIYDVADVADAVCGESCSSWIEARWFKSLACQQAAVSGTPLEHRQGLALLLGAADSSSRWNINRRVVANRISSLLKTENYNIRLGRPVRLPPDHDAKWEVVATVSSPALGTRLRQLLTSSPPELMEKDVQLVGWAHASRSPSIDPARSSSYSERPSTSEVAKPDPAITSPAKLGATELQKLNDVNENGEKQQLPSAPPSLAQLPTRTRSASPLSGRATIGVVPVPRVSVSGGGDVCESMHKNESRSTVEVILNLEWSSAQEEERSRQIGETWDVQLGRDGDPGRGLYTFEDLTSDRFPLRVSLGYEDAGTWRVRRASDKHMCEAFITQGVAHVFGHRRPRAWIDVDPNNTTASSQFIVCEAHPVGLPVQLRGIPPFSLRYGQPQMTSFIQNNILDSSASLDIVHMMPGSGVFEVALHSVEDKFCENANAVETFVVRRVRKTTCQFVEGNCLGNNLQVLCNGDEGPLIVRYRQETRTLERNGYRSVEEHTKRVPANRPFVLATHRSPTSSPILERVPEGDEWPDGAVVRITFMEVVDAFSCRAEFQDDGREHIIFATPSVDMSVFGDVCSGNTADLVLGFVGVPPYQFQLHVPGIGKQAGSVEFKSLDANTTLVVSTSGSYSISQLRDGTHCSAGEGIISSVFVPGNPAIRVIQPNIEAGERPYVGDDVVVELVRGTPPWSLQLFDETNGLQISRTEVGIRSSNFTFHAVTHPIRVVRVSEDLSPHCFSAVDMLIMPKMPPSAHLFVPPIGDFPSTPTEIASTVAELWLARSPSGTVPGNVAVALVGGVPPYAFSLVHEGSPLQIFSEVWQPSLITQVDLPGRYELESLTDAEGSVGTGFGSVVAQHLSLGIPEFCVCPVAEQSLSVLLYPNGPSGLTWKIMCEIRIAGPLHVVRPSEEIACAAGDVCQIVFHEVDEFLSEPRFREFRGAHLAFATSTDLDGRNLWSSENIFPESERIVSVAGYPDITLDSVWIRAPPPPRPSREAVRIPRWDFMEPYDRFSFSNDAAEGFSVTITMDFARDDPEMFKNPGKMALLPKFRTKLEEFVRSNVGFGIVTVDEYAIRTGAGASVKLSIADTAHDGSCSKVEAIVSFIERFNADNVGAIRLRLIGAQRRVEECLFLSRKDAHAEVGGTEVAEVLRRNLSRICLRHRIGKLSKPVGAAAGRVVPDGTVREFMAIELAQITDTVSHVTTASIRTERTTADGLIINGTMRIHPVTMENSTAYLPIQEFFVDQAETSRSAQFWRVSIAEVADSCGCNWQHDSAIVLRTSVHPHCELLSQTHCAGTMLEFDCFGEDWISVKYAIVDVAGNIERHISELGPMTVDAPARLAVHTFANTSQVRILDVSDVSGCEAGTVGPIVEISRPSASLRRVPDSCLDMSDASGHRSSRAQTPKNPNPSVQLEVSLTGSPPWTISYSNTHTTHANAQLNSVVVSNITKSPYIFKEHLLAHDTDAGDTTRANEAHDEQLIAQTHIRLLSVSDRNCEHGDLLESSVTASIPTLVLVGGGDVCEGSLADFNVTIEGDDTKNGHQVDWTYGWVNIHMQTGEEQYARSLVSVPRSRSYDSFRMGFEGQYRLTRGSDRNGCVANVRNAALPVVVRPLPTAELSGDGMLCQDEVGGEGSGHMLQLSLSGTPPWRVEFVNSETTRPSDPDAVIFVEDDIHDFHAQIPAPTGQGGVFQLVAVLDRYCRYEDPEWASALAAARQRGAL